jgi:hypothetical protein
MTGNKFDSSLVELLLLATLCPTRRDLQQFDIEYKWIYLVAKKCLY